MDHRKGRYDEAQRARALSVTTMRAVVAGYLVYLGVSLFRDYLRGDSTLSPLAAWASFLGFCVGGLLFGLYTWKRYQAALEAAKLPPEEKKAPEET